LHIIAHRGLWETREERNSEKAFIKALEHGFGIETDFRDFMGRVVVSHDPAIGAEKSFADFCELYLKYGNGEVLAINIKADGLQDELLMTLAKYGINNYFVFDMSLPDMIIYSQKKAIIYSRLSEYEKTPLLYDEAEGVWLDCFLSDWVTDAVLSQFLYDGKKVCLVSPELHGREHKEFWKRLKEFGVSKSANIMICTDYPDEARSFFYDKD
jgi:glycerophosphoryl diester phosphodiesterase